MVQGGSMKKGSSSKGGSSSQKLSDKKMRKMEARVLEEKLVTLRATVFEPDGKDRNVCAPLAPFMKYDRNGLDCTIDFYSKLPADAKLWAFELVKSNMEDCTTRRATAGTTRTNFQSYPRTGLDS